MSRPPSARPKTSAGSRATSAGRAHPPPPDPYPSQPAPRPPTRSSNGVAGGAVAFHPPPSRMSASRSGFSDAPPQRLGTAARPPSSAVRPGTGLALPVNRPVTQQGIGGVRAVSRMATGSTRQVYDKSYFMGQLRAKANQLIAEIGRLEQIAAKGEKDRQDLAMYEKRAEEQALELKEQQGQLIDCNMIIDYMNTNRELTEIELEANEVRAKADEMASGMEELYAERREKEAEIEDTLAKIEQQKRTNQETLANMDPGIRDRYEECREKAEQLKEDVSLKQQELTDLENLKHQLESELNNSPLKQKAMVLHERLLELEDKERRLLAEKTAEKTPEERKQELIDKVKANNEEIATMEKQIEAVSEQIDAASEELREYEAGYSEALSAMSDQYKSVMQRDAIMQSYLDDYDEKKRLLNVEMEEYSTAVVSNLRKISANLAKISKESMVTEMDMSALQSAHAKADPNELKDLHVRLQEELLSLKELRTRLGSDTETIVNRSAEVREEIDRIGDTESINRQATQNSESLASRRDELKGEVPAAEDELAALKQQLNTTRTRVEGSQAWDKAQQLIRKLQKVAESTEIIRANVEAKQANTNFEPLKAEALLLMADYNAFLVQQSAHKR